jgi:hypothetical protein
MLPPKKVTVSKIEIQPPPLCKIPSKASVRRAATPVRAAVEIKSPQMRSSLNGTAENEVIANDT